MKIADMHCDTIARLWEIEKERKDAEELLENTGHVSLRRMKQGNYLLQNFALFLSLKQSEDPWKDVLSMADLFDREIEKNKDRIGRVFCYEDIGKNREAGKLSAVLTVEEGGVCKGSLENLRELYRRGVRMMTLSWNYPNGLCFPNVKMPEDGEKADFTVPETEKGLTETGFAFVEEMQHLGMIVDVSHLSDAGFWDVCKTVKGPFVASHSNARACCRHVRNMTDEMIRALAEKGGVMGLNFCADFLKEEQPGVENPGTIADVVRHANHIIGVGGVECLGLGSDFDGIPGHKELPGAEAMPMLLEALHDSGLNYDTVDKIAGENVLRLYREAWKNTAI